MIIPADINLIFITGETVFRYGLKARLVCIINNKDSCVMAGLSLFFVHINMVLRCSNTEIAYNTDTVTFTDRFFMM